VFYCRGFLLYGFLSALQYCAILAQAAYSDAGVVKVVPVITKSTASSSAERLFARKAPSSKKMQSLLAALLVLTAANAQKMTADIVSCPG